MLLSGIERCVVVVGCDDDIMEGLCPPFSLLTPSPTLTIIRAKLMPIAGLVISRVINWNVAFPRYAECVRIKHTV